LKFSVEVFPPLWTAFFRFVLGASCVLIWCLLSKQDIWPKRGEWRVLGVIAGLFAFQIGCMNIGYANTTAVMGAVLIASNPVFAVVFTHFLVAGERLHLLKAVGLALAFVGTALVLLEAAGPDGLHLSAWGNWLVLLSASLLGLRMGLSARALQAIDPVRVALWQMLLALPVFAVAASAVETIHWEAMAWPPMLGLLFQGVVIAGFCFVAQFHLMRRYSPGLMVAFNFVSPIAGVIFGVWLLGESVGRFLLFGLLMVAAGLVMIARPAPYGP
jgi:drug/metabolite transporter (DMT)-like permease